MFFITYIHLSIGSFVHFFIHLASTNLPPHRASHSLHLPFIALSIHSFQHTYLQYDLFQFRSQQLWLLIPFKVVVMKHLRVQMVCYTWLHTTRTTPTLLGRRPGYPHRFQRRHSIHVVEAILFALGGCGGEAASWRMPCNQEYSSVARIRNILVLQQWYAQHATHRRVTAANEFFRVMQFCAAENRV